MVKPANMFKDPRWGKDVKYTIFYSNNQNQTNSNIRILNDYPSLLEKKLKILQGSCMEKVLSRYHRKRGKRKG